VISRRSVLAGIACTAIPGRARAERLSVPQWPDQVVEPLAVFRCGPQPKGLAIHPDARQVWVTYLDGPPSVGVYTLPEGVLVGEISLGDHGAVEVALREDGRTAWVSQMETHRVYEIDVSTLHVRRWFDTESNWSKVIEPSPDGSRLYVSNWNFDDVSDISLASGRTERRLATVKTPRGLYATRDSRHLYVAGFGDGALERIDLETGAREPCFVGTALRHLAPTRDERALFLTDMGGRCLWRWEVAEQRHRRLARTDANPNTCALTPDGRVVCVSNRGPNGGEGYLADGPAWGSVLVIDAEDGEILDSIVGGNQCTALAVAGDLLVFSDFRDDTIRVYRLPPYEELKAAGWPRRDVHARDLWKARRPG
jgi:DNA-binding beta-propeller fold protein YncE